MFRAGKGRAFPSWCPAVINSQLVRCPWITAVSTEFLMTVPTLQENTLPEMAISANLKDTRNGHRWPGCLAGSRRVGKDQRHFITKDIHTNWHFWPRILSSPSLVLIGWPTKQLYIFRQETWSKCKLFFLQTFTIKHKFKSHWGLQSFNMCLKSSVPSEGCGWIRTI